jgi:CrcB protein
MGRVPVLAAVAAGGATGSLGRYGLAVALPHEPTGFPWATFLTNAAGCFAIGVLMVVVARVLPGRPLLRPFLGAGLLGGFTTFSTYALEIQRMVDAGARGTAMVYLAGTVLAALAAAYAGSRATRLALIGRARRRPTGPAGPTSPDELVGEGLVIIDPVEVVRYVGRRE